MQVTKTSLARMPPVASILAPRTVTPEASRSTTPAATNASFCRLAFFERSADRFHRVRISGMTGDIIDVFAVEVDGAIVTQARNMVDARLDHADSPLGLPGLKL